MHTHYYLLALCVGPLSATPLMKMESRSESNAEAAPIPDAPWYRGSAASAAEAVEKRSVEAAPIPDAPWYRGSAASAAEAVEKRSVEAAPIPDAPWYRGSAASAAEAIEKRDVAPIPDAPWYRGSAASASEAVGKRGVEAAPIPDAPWYRGSAASAAEAVEKRDAPIPDAPWYRGSAASAAEAVEKRDAPIPDAPWYRGSAASAAEAVEKRDVAPIPDAPWYRGSPASAAEAVEKRDVAPIPDAPWYRGSAASAAAGLSARGQVNDKASAKMQELQEAAFGNKRTEHLRVSSEHGKAFFEFVPKPRNDTVDRWHIPEAIRPQYNSAESDADRVSILNMYLFVTGRTPLPASILGFTPTMMLPGLPEGGNEVGYGYALEGQHQYHCTGLLADAIEIGKDSINDFYLRHVIHCLGLLKHLASKLTDAEPLTLLTPEAEALVKAHVPQTRTKPSGVACGGA